MSGIKTGGPAFPTARVNINGVDEQNGIQAFGAGMTLRDYFAAKAMHAFLIRPVSMTAPDEVIAEAAYNTADAMLKERSNV